MSDAFWMAFFAFVTSLLAAVQSYLNNRKAQEIATKVAKVHDDMNGKLSELVTAKEEAARAKALLEAKEKS